LAVLIAPRQSRDCLRGKVLANSPLRCGRSVRRWPRALPHSHFVSSLPRGRVFAPVRFRSCPPPGEGNPRRIALSRYALLALLASCLSPTSSCARNAYSAQTCPSSLPRRNFLLAGVYSWRKPRVIAASGSYVITYYLLPITSDRINKIYKIIVLIKSRQSCKSCQKRYLHEHSRAKRGRAGH